MRWLTTCILFCVFMVCGVVFAESIDTPSSWAEVEVSRAIELGLVPQELQSDYHSEITRGEFAEIVMTLQQVWENEGYTSSLADLFVKLDISINLNSFSDASSISILNCAALGIIEGDGKGHFMPDASITRQQASKILYKVCDVFDHSVLQEDATTSTVLKGVASFEMPHTFNDGAIIRSWARTPIQWCYRHSLMQGTSEGTFSPNGHFTREQAIITLLRLHDMSASDDGNLGSVALDYYPVYDIWNNVISWVDSKLEVHSVSEIGYFTDRDAKIGFVIDYSGAGSQQGRLINQKGETLLGELWKAEGIFNLAQVDYPYVYLINRFDIPLPEDVPSMGVINIETGKLWTEKTLENVTKKNYAADAMAPATIQMTPEGGMVLINKNGKRLSKVYGTAMSYIEGNLYIGVSSSQPFICEIVYCDGVNEAKVIRIESISNSWSVFKLGSGVYAVQNDAQKISLFDAFGETLNTITTEDSFSLNGGANGLLRVSFPDMSNDFYYTQSGKKLGMLQ